MMLENSSEIGTQTDSTLVPYILKSMKSRRFTSSAQLRRFRTIKVNKGVFISPVKIIKNKKSSYVITASHRPNGISGDFGDMDFDDFDMEELLHQPD